MTPNLQPIAVQGEIGLFYTWDDCAKRVLGVSGNRFKRYRSFEEALGKYRQKYELGAVHTAAVPGSCFCHDHELTTEERKAIFATKEWLLNPKVCAIQNAKAREHSARYCDKRKCNDKAKVTLIHKPDNPKIHQQIPALTHTCYCCFSATALDAFGPMHSTCMRISSLDKRSGQTNNTTLRNYTYFINLTTHDLSR
ncbi:hypothetical protein SERLADRAFT_404752 [Serpula lacrymans var. lacrymans S7.9]|uniref:Ribonuclease H1 N-terminal domain-containing protein n=1 Tax=Serpula lacrymans var. lacrymans (strain S7.9) TaxID=578457 RepID=F8NEQ5_SERL9|nr:uncharacterized protein SERLADRAFT_404752 [Serpula lacrymans var. lacrymans S7.9]EGO30689.1 hypothetical protein SERLADRAFT_404752 [Serpula lacrymans var. lacrymans S7.9]